MFYVCLILPKILSMCLSLLRTTNFFFFIEFLVGYCLINPINTGRLVMKGELNDGLYKVGSTRATGSASNFNGSSLKLEGKIVTCSAVIKNRSANVVSK